MYTIDHRDQYAITETSMRGAGVRLVAFEAS